MSGESKPALSVIMPVYNVGPYLCACVDSILCQTFGDFELILVDDGSTDGCPAICDAYEGRDPRVRVVHKENGGLSSARNAGMRAARAELRASAPARRRAARPERPSGSFPRPWRSCSHAEHRERRAVPPPSREGASAAP